MVMGGCSPRYPLGFVFGFGFFFRITVPFQDILWDTKEYLLHVL